MLILRIMFGAITASFMAVPTWAIGEGINFFTDCPPMVGHVVIGIFLAFWFALGYKTLGWIEKQR